MLSAYTSDTDNETAPLQSNKIHETINKERIDCLLHGYSEDVLDELDINKDVFYTIQKYYNDNVIGKYITYNEFCNEYTVHLNAQSSDRSRDWPKNLYDASSRELRYNLISIIVLLMELIGICVILFFIQNRIIGFIFILILSVSLFAILMIIIYKFTVHIIDPSMSNYSLLYFNFTNNMIQEWRIKATKRSQYGNLKWNKAQYFCEIANIIDVISIDRINKITLCKPSMAKEPTLVYYGFHGKRIIYHDGYIEFNDITTEIPYGVNCVGLLKRIKNILNEMNCNGDGIEFREHDNIMRVVY